MTTGMYLGVCVCVCCRILGLHIKGIEENSRTRREGIFQEDECIVQINDTELIDKSFTQYEPAPSSSSSSSSLHHLSVIILLSSFAACRLRRLLETSSPVLSLSRFNVSLSFISPISAVSCHHRIRAPE